MQRYTQRITFSCDEETKAKLKSLADKEGSSSSWIIRRLIKAAYEDEFWSPELGFKQPYPENSS